MRRERPASRRPAPMLAGDEDGDPEVARLEAALAVDRADLAAELAAHPDLHYRAHLHCARLESRLAVAEMDARAALARTASYLRDQARDRPQPPTEEQLAARAEQHADVDRARRHAAELRRLWLQARALAASYDERGRVLESLAGRDARRTVPRRD